MMAAATIIAALTRLALAGLSATAEGSMEVATKPARGARYGGRSLAAA